MQSFLTCFGQGHICPTSEIDERKGSNRWHHHAQTIYFGHISQVPQLRHWMISFFGIVGDKVVDYLQIDVARHFSQRIDDWASSRLAL